MAGAEQKRALVYRESAHGTHAVLKLARNLVIKVYESATPLTFEMKVIVKDFLENNKEIEWNLEKLIDASRQGDCILYEEMIEQLRFNNVDKHIQDLQTLIAISWSVSEYESTQSTTLNKQLYNLYYNLNLKENTLIEILGEDTYNKLYEEA